MLSRLIGWMGLATLPWLGGVAVAQELMGPWLPEAAPPAIHWQQHLSLAQLGRSHDSLLLGSRGTDQIEFSLRRDRLTEEAELELHLTPSPALVPKLSHVRVYLNESLAHVLPLAEEEMGQQIRRKVSLDPAQLMDHNRIRLEFVGHYTDLCEDPSHSALWLNLSRSSELKLKGQNLALVNDLAYFPRPFIDAHDSDKPRVRFLLAEHTDALTQQAAGVLASYFGSLALWRPLEVEVLFEQLANTQAEHAEHVIVLASNNQRPDFLQDLERYPLVDGPVVELIDHPTSPYGKMLLVLGRDAEDLLAAAQTLALPNHLLRGARVSLKGAPNLPERLPYDAPNWLRTNQKVAFGTLKNYPQQLQSSGVQLAPLYLTFKLPPDVFIWRNQGLAVALDYRYTPPMVSNDSRLNVNFNEQLVFSEGLSQQGSLLAKTRAAVTQTSLSEGSAKFFIASNLLKAENQLRFNFNYTSSFGSAQRDNCQSALPIENQGLIDDQSSLDLTGLYHYAPLPNLGFFIGSAYPFSRMADLSQTLVLLEANSSARQLASVFETLALVGARTGLAGYGVSFSHDLARAQEDRDLLLFGPLAHALGEPPQPLLVEAQQRLGSQANDSAEPLAAFLGWQSPYHEQRSVLAILANTDGHELLRTLYQSPSEQAQVQGAMAVLRVSGVSTSNEGQTYYVGELPWWMLVWYHLSHHPLLLAVLAIVGALLASLVLWRSLRWVAHKRLAGGQ